MKPDAKMVGKRRRAARREEIADLRAELDDFLRRVPTLSRPELDQAKEKLIQKLAYSTNRVTRPSIDDIRKKIDPKIIYYGINILLAGVLFTNLFGARSVSARSVSADYSCYGLGQQQCEGEYSSSCVWCPEDKDAHGAYIPAHCYNPRNDKECDECPSC